MAKNSEQNFIFKNGIGRAHIVRPADHCSAHCFICGGSCVKIAQRFFTNTTLPPSAEPSNAQRFCRHRPPSAPEKS